VAEAIELRSDLADLARNELVMVNDIVGSERAAGRPAWDTQREAPLAEHRHARFIEMAHLVELAGFNQFQCVQDFCRRYQICGADLIVLTPFGRPPRTDRGRAGRRRLSLSCSDDADPVSGLGGGRVQAEERAGEAARRKTRQRTAIVVDTFGCFHGGSDEIGVVMMIAHYAHLPEVCINILP